MNQQQFENFTASSLYCEKCKAAMPVRERLLLVLPDKEIFDYLCTGCGSSVGRREITGGKNLWRQRWGDGAGGAGTASAPRHGSASPHAVVRHAHRFYRHRRYRRADAASFTEIGARSRRRCEPTPQTSRALLN